MKRIAASIVLILVVTACAVLPGFEPADPARAPAIEKSCATVFPVGKWRFVHSIEATLPGGQKNFLIGVTVISPEIAQIQSVIMTIEGLVLFDARYRPDNFTISRAIPPFDSRAFARGLMDDVKLVFLEPSGHFVKAGTWSDGTPVCRYRNQDGISIDISPMQNNLWTIHKYNKNARLSRSVEAYACDKANLQFQQSIPCRLQLTAHGRPGYTLYMKLLEAESVQE
jgi:hypothetical protein